MTEQEKMKEKANSLLDAFADKLKEASDIAQEYYEECGSVNGMSFKYEYSKIINTLKNLALDEVWNRLLDQKELLTKINKRVNKHIDDIDDEEEFKKLKLHRHTQPTNNQEVKKLDDVVKVNRLR